jgi:tRNA (guanine26-N2/guanine27-N2)-dimethyltransferase
MNNNTDNKYSICEGLSATGLRSIRYYLELPKKELKEIICNDADPRAIDVINNNISINNIQVNHNTNNIFKVSNKDASNLLNNNNYGIVDLDPYGTAMHFIDAALNSIKKHGLLCVTFTDMPVLCGVKKDTCFYRYNVLPQNKATYCHEV